VLPLPFRLGREAARQTEPGASAPLGAEHEIVLTSNGRPFALLTDVDEDTFEQKITALRRTRARALLDRIRDGARAGGLDRLTMRQVDAIIARTRQERRGGR
jgi:antitoxin (DNA-binding transcriptional repressor) of toxin-antitoxin stability system